MPPRKFSMPLCLLVTVLVCLPLWAGNWPRFRGINGMGVSDDKDIPIRFDQQDGVLWKVAMPGPGNSSPVVWGDRVLLQSSSSDGKQRVLMCLDAARGRALWSRSIAARKAHINPKNSWASSTPATDGDIVVNAFWDGKDVSLAAYDFQGKRLWLHNLGLFTSQHGPGASPIIFGNKVLFANDQDGTSVLLALDKKTGEIVWKAPRDAYRACYSAPFILERPGARPQLVVTSTTSIRSYDPDNGTVLWSYLWKFTAKMPLRTTGSSILANGMMFACAGDGGGDRHMIALRLGEASGNQAPGKLHPALAWENKKDFPYVPTMLTRGGNLYFVNDRGYAGCFLAETGQQVWFHRLPEATFTASPVLIDGKIYAPSEEGDVYVIAAEPAYRLLAKNTLGERIRATPAVANNRLYIRGQNHLFCIGKPQTGKAP
jgi:outer membrane protein assembly factor BamB